MLVSKLSNFVDAYWQNFWFAVVSCMLLIKSRLYSFSKKTPYKKEQSYALLDLETVENEQSILTLPKRKLSNNNSIHDYSSKRKIILIEDFSLVEKEFTMKKYGESL